jgi:hypothetical protein
VHNSIFVELVYNTISLYSKGLAMEDIEAYGYEVDIKTEDGARISIEKLNPTHKEKYCLYVDAKLVYLNERELTMLRNALSFVLDN